MGACRQPYRPRRPVGLGASGGSCAIVRACGQPHNSRMTSITPLRLAGSVARPLFLLVAIMTGLTAVMAVVTSLANRAAHGIPTAVLVFGVTTVSMVALVVMVMLAARASVRIVQDESERSQILVVSTGFGTRRISLATASIDKVSPAHRPDLKPARRVFGLGLPGAMLGVFALRNGESALCLIRGNGPVCVVREPGNAQPVLVSLAHPEVLLAYRRQDRAAATNVRPMSPAGIAPSRFEP